MKKYCLLPVFLLLISVVSAQKKLELDGQASLFTNYSPDNVYGGLFVGRYIPSLSYIPFSDSIHKVDFEVSANAWGSIASTLFDTNNTEGDVQPYRLWARYSGKQFEFRVGLQKIDFGPSKVVRSLQWFNQIDPRDPLRLTNGVYGALARYYFINNTNVWLWGLYGNEKTRGFDVIKTYKDAPEFGGRIQFPLMDGEVALSYHHRTANAMALIPLKRFEKIPEDRFAIDGQWDIGVGIWFEASFTHKNSMLGRLTNQSLVNLGTDYTFGIGNGIGVVVEHLMLASDADYELFKNTVHITAATLSYPLGLSDGLSAVGYHIWGTDDPMIMLNYEHQFNLLTAYVIPYYNPSSIQGIQENQLVNTFSGPGIQVMIVYKH